MCILNALTKYITYIVSRETTALQLDIFNNRKQHMDEVKKTFFEDFKDYEDFFYYS